MLRIPFQVNRYNLAFVCFILCVISGIYFMRKCEKIVINQISRNSSQDFIASSDILLFRQGGPVNETTEESLIHYIKNQIFGPSLIPMNLSTEEKHYSQYGQSLFVDNLLHQRKGGFFVECGAATGVNLSNSLFFERSRNWTGILIEANPVLFDILLKYNRRCYQMNACLSPIKEPRQIQFSPAGYMGGLEDYIGDLHRKNVETQMKNVSEISVQCFSLYHIMQALGRDHIDYLSLDVEGAELDILMTIPWEKLHIDVITAEYNMNRDLLAKYKAFMNSTGLYNYAGEPGGIDVVFVRKYIN